MKAYISGGMTGIPEFNFPMFDAVSGAWEGDGHVAVSPAEHDREVLMRVHSITPEEVPGYAEGDWTKYEASVGKLGDLLAWDFVQIAQECDAIVMLPGWENSTGARYERFVAEATGKAVILAQPWPIQARDVVDWKFLTDPEQKRMNCVLMSRFGGVEAKVA